MHAADPAERSDAALHKGVDKDKSLTRGQQMRSGCVSDAFVRFDPHGTPLSTPLWSGCSGCTAHGYDSQTVPQHGTDGPWDHESQRASCDMPVARADPRGQIG